MKKIGFLFLLILAPFVKAQTLDSQEVEFRVTLPEVALVSLKPENTTIILEMGVTQKAGEKIEYISKSDSQLWLNYTCSIAPDSPSKNISAQISSETVPEGLVLQLKVSEYTGTGKGQFGTSIPKINLQNFPQIILSNIGGSYTNQGSYNGHKLEYNLEVTNYKLLDSEKSNTLTIVYTLSDN